MSDDHGQESVGSVSEEAAKLLKAVQDWARESGSDYAGAAAGMASGATAAFRDVDEHIATGGEDCRFCPVCQAISVVRHTSPEVRQHLASAASSLMHAAAGLLATYAPDATRPRQDPGMEKIDLGDGDWEDG
jgi:hypothetical protein